MPAPGGERLYALPITETKHERCISPAHRLGSVPGAALFCSTPAAATTTTTPTPLAGTSVQTLSGRADMVSGGSALVEVKLPTGASASALKVTVGSTDVSTAFTTRSDGRTVGLVTGLANGTNTLTATSSNNSFAGATLTLTNHADRRSGAAEQAGHAVGLRDTRAGRRDHDHRRHQRQRPLDQRRPTRSATSPASPRCSIARLTPVSVTTGDGGCSFVLPDPSPTIAIPAPTTPANSCFQPYVTGTTAAALVASTTPLGATTAVPYIVRVERGTINRGIYRHRGAVRSDQALDRQRAARPSGPARWSIRSAPAPASRAPSSAPSRSGPTTARSPRGVMVVDNSLTDSLYNSNRILDRRDRDDDEGVHRQELR